MHFNFTFLIPFRNYNLQKTKSNAKQKRLKTRILRFYKENGQNYLLFPRKNEYWREWNIINFLSISIRWENLGLCPASSKKFASLSLSHHARPSTLNTCGAIRSTPPPVVHGDQSSTDEHDPRSAGVTADNFIDNCHASNHAHTHSVRTAHGHACTHPYIYARVDPCIRTRAAAIESPPPPRRWWRQPHRYRASLGNRHPVAEIRARVCVRRTWIGGARSRSRETEGERKRPGVLSATMTDVAFKRR